MTARTGGLLVLVLLLAAGCATRPVTTLPPLDDWQTRQAVLGAVGEWQARGRIGLVAGDEAQSGSLDWRQDDERVSVSIRGPLGAGGISLEGSGDGLTLRTADGETLVLSRPEQELREIYGWTIPVDSLSYWLLGIPDPSRPGRSEVDAAGRLETLEQASWALTYDRYRMAAGVMLPYRIKARSGDIRLTIVVRDWQFVRVHKH